MVRPLDPNSRVNKGFQCISSVLAFRDKRYKQHLCDFKVVGQQPAAVSTLDISTTCVLLFGQRGPRGGLTDISSIFKQLWKAMILHFRLVIDFYGRSLVKTDCTCFRGDELFECLKNY